MTPLPESLLGDTRWLRRLARSLVDNPHDAADVVQDTVVRALQLPPQKVERPRSFLAAVMRNLVYDRRRRDRKRPEVEKHAARYACVPATGDVVERAAVRRSLVDAVRGLDEPYRGALWLRFFEELPPREVAARLSVPVETARTRLKRGLAQLRAQLDREHGRRAAWTGPLCADLGLRVAVPVGTPMPFVAAVAGVGMVAATVAVALLSFSSNGSTPPTVQQSVVFSPAEGSIGAQPSVDVPAKMQEFQRSPAIVGLPAVVEGTVVDEQSRRPLADVAVAWRRCSETATVTDASGRFRLTTESLSGADCELVMSRSDFVTQTVELARPHEDLALGKLALPPGTRVSGRVVDADNRPAPDVRLLGVLDFELSLGWPPGSASEMRAMVEGAREIGRTDRAGYFVATERLAPLSTRELLLAVGPDGVGWVDMPLRRARSSSSVEIRLRPDTGFEAVCVDEVGQRLAGVLVTLEPRFSPLGTLHAPLVETFGPHPDLRARFTAHTDAAGVVRFDAVPLPPASGEGYAVRFEAPGFSPARFEQVALGRTGARVLEVRLERTEPLRLTGIVRDDSGRAVAGASVVARSGKRLNTSLTDASGRYVIEGLESSLQDAVALAKADGYAYSMGFVSFGSSREATLNLRLESAADLVEPAATDEIAADKSLRAEIFDAYGAALDVKSVRLFETHSRHALPLRLTIGLVEAQGLYAGDWLLHVTPHDGPEFEHPFEVRADQDRVHVTCVTDLPVAGSYDSPELLEPSITLRDGEQQWTIRLPRVRGT